MKATKENLDLIDRYLEQRKLDFLDFKLEIKDHIASQTEDFCEQQKINFEDAFPVQFRCCSGGPNVEKRKVEVSNEACLRHNMRLSLNQFVRSDFILVCYHLMCRSASYTMGLIKCRSNY